MNRYFKFTLLVMCSLVSATSLFARWVTQEEVTRADGKTCFAYPSRFWK